MWRKGPGPEAVSSWGLGSVTVGTGAQRGIRVRGGQVAEEPVAVRARACSSQAGRAGRNSHGRASERGRRCLKYLRAWEPQEKSVRFFSQGDHDEPGDLGSGQPHSHAPLGTDPGARRAHLVLEEGAACGRSCGGFGLSRSWETGRGLPAVREEGEHCRGQRGGGWCLASLADSGFPTPGTPRHLDRG